MRYLLTSAIIMSPGLAVLTISNGPLATPSYEVHYVMCWHALPAYWGGIMPGAPALEGVSSARIVYPRPTDGIAEIEPSLMWSPAVLAGARAACLLGPPGVAYLAFPAIGTK